MTDKRFESLLTAYIEGEITEEQLAELHGAVSSSEDFRLRFQQETRLHVLMRETLAEQVEIQSFQEPALQCPIRKPRSLKIATVMTTTVAMLVCIVVGLSIYYTGTDSGPDVGICLNISGSGELHVQRGSRQLPATRDMSLKVGDLVIAGKNTQAILRLSDGSVLNLEPQSSVGLISTAPIVKLEKGEVLFEITPRKEGEQAFKVVTKHSTITVLGTVFTLKENGRTELRVYEGRVTFTRNSDNASIEVSPKEMVMIEDGPLVTRKLYDSSSDFPISLMSLLPTDDVTLDRGLVKNEGHLKVQGGVRKSFLRFVVPDIGKIRSAKLRLTQDVDPGLGTLSFFVGDNSDWDEQSFTEANSPQPLSEIAQFTGVVRRRQVVEVDLSSAVQKPGPITIIITLDKTGWEDIWFGSRESDIPPQLILTYESPSLLEQGEG